MAYVGRTPANAAITAADLDNGIVTADKLATNAVTTVKVNADAVTNAKTEFTPEVTTYFRCASSPPIESQRPT